MHSDRNSLPHSLTHPRSHKLDHQPCYPLIIRQHTHTHIHVRPTTTHHTSIHSSRITSARGNLQACAAACIADRTRVRFAALTAYNPKLAVGSGLHCSIVPLQTCEVCSQRRGVLDTYIHMYENACGVLRACLVACMAHIVSARTGARFDALRASCSLRRALGLPRACIQTNTTFAELHYSARCTVSEKLTTLWQTCMHA